MAQAAAVDNVDAPPIAAAPPSTGRNRPFRGGPAHGQACGMTPPPKPLRLRLQSPSDVLATVPYLLGFHPADSIVVIGLRGAGLVFQARGDLPPRSTSPAEIARFAGFLTDVLRAQAVTGALLVGYGTPERVTPTIMATAKAVHAVGVTVLDQLRTDAGRYWSYLCSNPACCPPEGVPYQIAGSVVAAEATLAGCVALPDRAALVRTLGPPAGPALAAIRLATAGAERQRSGVPRGQATAAGPPTTRWRG
jgi:hypothetical protein